MNIIIFNLCSVRVVSCANFVSDLRLIPSTKLESSKSRLLPAHDVVSTLKFRRNEVEMSID